MTSLITTNADSKAAPVNTIVVTWSLGGFSSSAFDERVFLSNLKRGVMMCLNRLFEEAASLI
jgi:hypothetical protein